MLRETPGWEWLSPAGSGSPAPVFLPLGRPLSPTHYTWVLPFHTLCDLVHMLLTRSASEKSRPPAQIPTPLPKSPRFNFYWTITDSIDLSLSKLELV